jgi:hypothetical protein
MIEDAWGVKFPEGSNDSLQLMGHLWEPLKVVHKPLFVHLASEGSILVTHLALQVRLPLAILTVPSCAFDSVI